MEADYAVMWERVRHIVWKRGFDLADLRTPDHRFPLGTRRRLQYLRREVCGNLAEAGYARKDIADFLFLSLWTVKSHLQLWRRSQV